MTIKPVHIITPPQWMFDPDLVRLLDILNHDGVNARMVGGCVRDIFYDKPIDDIDLACALSPEDVIELCKDANIRTIPTGLKHGTVTAHMNGKNIEITTLRRDVVTDGRHARVEPTNNWTDDAMRRDFTINALYADRDGSIYDPLGTGFPDIQNKIVRFIGDARQRIEEDYLRILRFFRFYADYHEGEADAESLKACMALKNTITSLSQERIEDELFKILSSNQAARSVGLMAQVGLFDLISDIPNMLQNVIALQNQLEQLNIPVRFYVAEIDRTFIGQKKTLKFFDYLDSFLGQWDGNIKHALYHFDRTVVIQGLLILKAKSNPIDDMIISDAMNRPVPVFPIIASDIMEAFKLDPGPAVGDAMKKAENIWIESDFQLKRNDILSQLDTD